MYYASSFRNTLGVRENLDKREDQFLKHKIKLGLK